MKISIFFACKMLIHDAPTNSFSGINILEEFNLPSVPAMLSELAIFSAWEKEAGDADEFNVTLIAKSNDDVIIAHESPATFSGKKRCRVTFNFSGFPITNFGALTFELFVAGNSHGKISIEVSKPEPSVSVSSQAT